jgi:lipoprotein signal peptidase
MEHPWFRKFMIVGAYPIHWKGFVTLGLMIAACTLSGYMFMSLNSEFRWVWAAAFLVAGAAGNCVIQWHMEDKPES